MRTIISIASVLILLNLTAQEVDYESIRRIEVEKFSNRIGLEMGMAVHNLAKARNQNVAIKVDRLNYNIFTYVDDGLHADKHNWLRRKANVAKIFEESSLGAKDDFNRLNITLEETFALEKSEYLARGGAIPIFVKNAGMVAIITVSGLHDVEDHKIIIDALKGKFF